jgi:hypothetical protein
MDDAPGMRGGKAARYLDAVFDGFPNRKRAGGQPLAQRFPFEQLRHGVGDAVVHADVEDGEDIGMRQGRDGPGLALEPRAPVGIAREERRKDLHGDIALQARVAGLVDLAHPACPDGRGDLIGAEAQSRRQRHAHA